MNKDNPQYQEVRKGIDERITFLEPDSEVVDELVLSNCTVHLECLDEQCYMLIAENSEHHWHLNIYISNRKSKAQVWAKVYEQEDKKDKQPVSQDLLLTEDESRKLKQEICLIICEHSPCKFSYDCFAENKCPSAIKTEKVLAKCQESIRKQTLREVGVKLDDLYNDRTQTSFQFGCSLLDFIANLKEGKMPNV